jgi:photosystem II stability/assembly factor-like uncharacterized protein
VRSPKGSVNIIFGLIIAAAMTALFGSCGSDSVTNSTATDTSSFNQVLDLPGITLWERVWGAPTGELFLMGDDGLVYRNDGLEWDSLNSGARYDKTMHSVWGLQGDNLYFVGRISRGDTVYWDTVIDTTDGVIDTAYNKITAQIPDYPLVTNYNGLNFADADISDIEWGLYDIWGSSGNNIWAVGYDGTIVHYDGTSWLTSYTGGESPAYLTSVWGTSDSNVYTCGAGGALLHYDTAWSVIRSQTSTSLWDIWGLSADSIYMVGSNGLIMSYLDSTIARMTSPVTNALYSIWGTAHDNLWAVGWGGTILHYNGSTWTEEDKLTSFGLLSIWGSAENDIYAVGQTVLHYDGVNWSPVRVKRDTDIHDIWAGIDGSTKEVIAVGSSGRIMKSVGGDVFTAMSVNDGTVSTNLYGVGGFIDTALFVVGESGTILHRDDGDLTNWVKVTSGTSADLQAVAVLSRDLACVVGANGTVLLWDGATWTVQTGLGSDDMNDVWISETSTDTLICVVGNSGAAYWYDGTWHAPTTGTTDDLVSVTGTSSGDFWAVTSGGALLHLTEGTWSSVSTGMSGVFTSVWTDDDGHLIIVGEGGLSFRYNIRTGTIKEHESKSRIDFRGVYGYSGENFFVVGDFNHIMHYRP